MSNFGTAQSLLEGGAYTYLFRFAIFQSEGGPVPNGATIVSATLSLYKSSFYDYTYQVSRMLRNWNETQATWSQWQAGQGWSVAGAEGVGTDYAATPDATVSVGWYAAVAERERDRGRAGDVDGYAELRVAPGRGERQRQRQDLVVERVHGDPTLRPKLVIEYSGGSSNVPPTVTLTSPANGTSVSAPATVVVSANASDSNGTVARVDFYAGSTLIGSDATSPYSVTWSNVAAGSYTLTAVAVDNGGASTTSSPVSLTVFTGATVTLQDGVSGYTGTRDTYLSSWNTSGNFGTAQSLLEGNAYTYLFRFAIFQSEGGPVPNGATIVSATLSLYKSSFYDYTYQVSRMLRNWSETQATWSQWQAGQGWSVAGAEGVGTDYAATPVATVSVGWTPGWLNANVTAGVQAMSTGTPNYGWRLVGVSGNGNDKSWWSSEYTASPTLRPKLVIQYTLP